MLTLLTLLHACVDGVCASALFASEQSSLPVHDLLSLFALYNLIAFGTQCGTGWLFDRHPSIRAAFLPLSVALLALGTLSLGWLPQALALGLGNSLFHACGGSLVLSHSKDFTRPGLFVSSGAIGLGLGLSGGIPAAGFLIPAILISCALFALSRPQNSRTQEQRQPASSAPRSSLVIPALLLLLLCVVLRGFGNSGDPVALNDLVFLSPLLIPCLVAGGKVLGGLVSDTLGLAQTILLIFLLGFFALFLDGLFGTVLAILAVNMTMPITLRLAHRCAPSYPGSMFGLTAACLLPATFLGTFIVVPYEVSLVAVFLLLTAARVLLSPQERQL